MRIDSRDVVSTDDPRVVDYLRLTDMDLRQRIEPERGVFMAEGHLVIERCAAQGLRLLSVLTSRRWLPRLTEVLADVDVTVLVAEDDLLRDVTGYRVHRGALAAVQRPPSLDVDTVLSEPGDLLVLEDLVDPTNVGLAIRSAVVQGIDAVVLSPGCADPLYRRSVKSSMGAVLRCRWARSEDWALTLERISADRRLIALTPDGESDLSAVLGDAMTGDVALLLGSEGPGLSAGALSASTQRARIPMASSEDSLNVAAATAVAAYIRASTRSMAR